MLKRVYLFITFCFCNLGSGLRHELQALPNESEKIGLEWKGEKGFHQVYNKYYYTSHNKESILLVKR